jgi:hypothetical protein
MDESEFIVRHDLGAAVAKVHLEDCRLSFHEQRSTGDVWCLATGPLGTFALPLIPTEVLVRVRRDRPAALGSVAQRPRERYATWQHVAITDDLVLALRARGDALDVKYLFADGVPFGGGGTGLPTHPPRRSGRAGSHVTGWPARPEGHGVLPTQQRGLSSAAMTNTMLTSTETRKGHFLSVVNVLLQLATGASRSAP